MPLERATGVGQPDVPAAVVLRRTVVPTLAVGAVGLIVIWALRGGPGATSALLGLVVAVAFFTSGIVLLQRFAAGGNPMTFIAVGMAVYLGQLLILFFVMIVLGRADWLDGKAFAAEVLLSIVVWQVFQIRAWRSARVSVYGSPDRSTESEGEQ